MICHTPKFGRLRKPLHEAPIGLTKITNGDFKRKVFIERETAQKQNCPLMVVEVLRSFTLSSNEPVLGLNDILKS